MSEALRTMFILLVWAFLMQFGVDYLQDLKATRELKNTLELATHDASMMIEADSFSVGDIVFDRTLAEQVFVSAFAKNTKTELVGSEYKDVQGKSFFKNPIKIVHMEYIDETTNPGITFPCNYGSSCGEAKYDIYQTVKGPSIVVVAETISPRGFSEKEQTIRQAVVYEYGSLK